MIASNQDHQTTKPEQSAKLPNLLSWLTKPKATHSDQSQQTEKIVILQNGQALFYKNQTNNLLSTHRINTKMIGISQWSRNTVDFTDPPYLLDKYACAYVINNKILEFRDDISNLVGVELIKGLEKDFHYIAFNLLMKQKKLILVDGHKFGCHFLGYENDTLTNHARYLIFIKQVGQYSQYTPYQISRLTGVCKKQALIITLSLNSKEEHQIQIEEIKPRISQHRKQHSKPIPTKITMTEQLAILKKKIGYDI